MKKEEWFKITEKEEAEFAELNIEIPEGAEFAWFDGAECTWADFTGYCWMEHDGTYYNWMEHGGDEWIASELDALEKLGAHITARETENGIEYIPTGTCERNPEPFFILKK